ncbi:hydroxysqualene dehydroxylase HpnE [Limnohabitans sp.]|uniref:hydroxysqualene dehydroxylase HpnE n=1 Tax=Limnohabitans sp. TaxID=1907725 RepID=UPI0038B912B3
MHEKHLRIVGAGWAGLSAAVAATQDGWHIHLYDTAHVAGGRARSLAQHASGHPLDNGQHVLIGAYRDTLSLMRTVGLDPEALLQRIPLNLRFADGQGLALPHLPQPWNVLAGIAQARGWHWLDKISLLTACWQWQRQGFTCPAAWTVIQLCAHHKLTHRVVQQLIEPLCLSALNTSVEQASALVFLRVLRDAIQGGPGSADLLIPTTDLSALFPHACLAWLAERGARIHLGQRITAAHLQSPKFQPNANQVVILACPAWEAARLTQDTHPAWSRQASLLSHAAITTVYLHCTAANFQGLPHPMLALHTHATQPAQFVFDRSALTGQPGLLACVVSASQGEREDLAQRVQQQVTHQLGLTHLHIIQTVVEKRATLSCTPGQIRPEASIAPSLYACGDYVQGPYPSTLEGAVRSGQQVVTQLRHL